MRSTLAAVLAALLLAPSLAHAQSSPFQPLPQAPPEQTEPVVPGTTSDDEGVSSLQQALLIGAGILFVLGIGFAIAYDARRNAGGEARPGRPLPKDELEEGVGERKKRDPRTAQKQKAAAKRARQARKKNRPVRK